MWHGDTRRMIYDCRGVVREIAGAKTVQWLFICDRGGRGMEKDGGEGVLIVNWNRCPTIRRVHSYIWILFEWMSSDVIVMWCDCDVMLLWCDVMWMWCECDVIVMWCDCDVMWLWCDVIVMWCDVIVMWLWCDVIVMWLWCEVIVMWCECDVMRCDCDVIVMWRINNRNQMNLNDIHVVMVSAILLHIIHSFIQYACGTRCTNGCF